MKLTALPLQAEADKLAATGAELCQLRKDQEAALLHQDQVGPASASCWQLERMEAGAQC